MLWEWNNCGKQVFILDLDGTLMPSAEIDNECFWQAVFHCYGNSHAQPELTGFDNVTDRGILEEWCCRELGRLPRSEETLQIKQRFFDLLESAYEQQSDHFKPLPGLIDWLETAAENKHVYIGIATGGWQHTARLKLRLSGLEQFDLPLASSDDAIQRTQIMQVAAHRILKTKADQDTVFTYVGDGIWDLQASQKLGWQFIGIASGARASQLAQAGAVNIRTDFR